MNTLLASVASRRIAAALFLEHKERIRSLTLVEWGAMLATVGALHTPSNYRLRGAVSGILFAARRGFVL